MNKIIIISLIIIGVLIIYFFNLEQKQVPSILYKPVGINLPINRKLFSKDFMVEEISADPKVYYLHNFLKDNESNKLIEYINLNKKESKLEINNNENPITIIKTTLRNSSTAYIKKGIFSNIEKRAANFSNVNINQVEGIHGIIYRKNEYFKEHLDTFNNGSEYLTNGGNRIATIFVYLNTLENEDGGCTNFIKLKHKIKPVKNDAIYFENIKNGIPDNRLFHEGESVLTDKLKYGLNIWIREGIYVD